MSNYGRNIEFRIFPQRGQRNGRYVNATGAPILLGAPCVGTGVIDELDQEEVEPVTAAVAPEVGRHGIILVNHTGVSGMQGRDPFLSGVSDAQHALPGQQVMLVSGSEVKVVLRNTVDHTFLQTRNYEGRTMVAGLEALTVGDYLAPGPGTDDGGYWAAAVDATTGWLVVTNVDEARAEVEARLNF